MKQGIFGLTGGIGCGKSAAAEFFAQAGFVVIDSDLISRELVLPGTPGLLQLQEILEPRFFGADGGINRAELGQAVFADAALRRRIEAVLHPLIRAEWQARTEVAVAAGQRALVVIPLLFEVGAQTEFSEIICVGCSAAVQRARLQKRGWSEEHIAQRLGAQWPLSKKADASHRVLWNDGTLELLQQQVRAVVGRGQ